MYPWILREYHHVISNVKQDFILTVPQNNEGQTSKALEKSASYGGGALEWMKMMTEWRAEDNLEGLEPVHFN